MKIKIIGSRGTESFILREALDKEGKDWEVVLVEAGESLNNRIYPADVLKQALPLFEECKGFAYEFDGKFFNHVPDKAKASVRNGFTKNMVSFFENVRFGKFKDQNGNEKEGILAKMHILDSAKWLKEMLLDAWSHGKKNLLGLSLDGDGRRRRMPSGKEIVDEITAIDEMTFVSVPAAGGRLTRLLASKEGGLQMKELFKKLVEMLRVSSPDMVEGLDVEKLTADQEFDVVKAIVEDFDKVKFAEKFGDKVRETLSTMIDTVIAAIEAGNKTEAIDMLKKLRGYQDEAGAPEESKAAADKKKADESGKAAEAAKATNEASAKASLDNIKKMEEDATRRNCTAVLNEKLSSSDLPDPVKESIRNRFKDSIFKTEVLDAAMKEQKDILAKLHESHMFVPAGRVEIGQTEKDMLQLAMDGFFDGADQKAADGKFVKKFNSFREAYKKITKNLDPSHEEILAGCYGLNLGESNRLSESISTTTFAQILGDSVTRKMVREYNAPGLSDWKKIVSEIVPISDFRTNRRPLMGGYGDLPTVAENGSYDSLTSPGDDENTYSIAKKGGKETISMETIANDDVSAIKRIPKKLGRAAVKTLYSAIFNLIKNNAATCYDGVVIFHAASHANLGSTALGDTGLTAAKVAMMNQLMYGSTTDYLGMSNNPKFLLVPSALEAMGNKLCKSNVFVGTNQNETSPNLHSTYGLEMIVVPEWTDATDWAVVADPNNVPTIEVGFYQGKEEPEMFVQDMPNVGSMFTNDQIIYKIRHIWGLVVLDYRGMYKMVVSGS